MLSAAFYLGCYYAMYVITNVGESENFSYTYYSREEKTIVLCTYTKPLFSLSTNISMVFLPGYIHSR